MSRWPKDHAEIDPFNPRAVGLCDRCGRVWNRDVLQWRFQWQGMTTVNTGFLECPKCWCPPDNHARGYRIPPDPLPVNQPRPINADPQQTDYRVTQTGDLRTTQNSDARIIDGDLDPAYGA